MRRKEWKLTLSLTACMILRFSGFAIQNSLAVIGSCNALYTASITSLHLIAEYFLRVIDQGMYLHIMTILRIGGCETDSVCTGDTLSHIGKNSVCSIANMSTHG